MITRCAGILIPLFSIRSAEDFGRGEFGGLLPMGRMALAMGHRLLQLLPIDEVAPGETSPYSALSVFALDPIYLSARLLPGIGRPECDAARAALRHDGEPVDQLKLREFTGELLLQSYRYFKSRADPGLRDGYSEFVEQHHGWLDDYTLFRAFKEKFGGAEWQSWPRSSRCSSTCNSLRIGNGRNCAGNWGIGEYSSAAILPFRPAARAWRSGRIANCSTSAVRLARHPTLFRAPASVGACPCPIGNGCARAISI